MLPVDVEVQQDLASQWRCLDNSGSILWMAASVLIVDDDPKIVRLVEHHLAPEGFVVRTAATAHEAREALAEENT